MNTRLCIARFLKRELTASRALPVFFSLIIVGCAGTDTTPVSSIVNPVSQASTSGLREAPAVRVTADKASYKRALYIMDGDTNKPIKILSNTYYRELGSISDGGGPLAESLDQFGNLYVANVLAQNVTEYAPGETSPSFTYNAQMNIPLGVTVDRQGNVYELDNGVSFPFLNEYFRNVNQVSQSCPLAYTPQAAAVDASGDVFLATLLGIYEFSGGLSGCHLTFLNSILANDIVLDSNNNLIVSEYSANAIEVLAPPYANVSRTIGSGFIAAYGLSINKKNKLVYVADAQADTVTVINYQTGQNVKILNGASYGISNAAGVVDAPNAVY